MERQMEKVIVGAALAFAATTLLPVAKAALGPIAADGWRSASGIMNRTKSFIRIAREEIEDIVAEAQFERMKKQMDRDIALLDGEREGF